MMIISSVESKHRMVKGFEPTNFSTEFSKKNSSSLFLHQGEQETGSCSADISTELQYAIMFGMNSVSINWNQKINGMMKRGFALLMLTMLSFSAGFAQINNYRFESGTTTYADITGGTTIVNAGSTVGAASTVRNIGFTFNYLGVNYTQFSANAAGLVRLGSTAVTTESANAIVSTTNTPKLMPWWDDMYTSAVASSGGVSFVSSGTAPNRVLTVQWKVTNSTTNTTVQNFQVKLYETSNKVEYLYGASNTNLANTASIGLGGLVAANEYLSITSTDRGAIVSTNTSITVSGLTSYNGNLNANWPGNNTVYSFTPTSSTVKPSSSFANPLLWLRADAGVKNVTYPLKNVSAANRTVSSELDVNWVKANSLFTNTTRSWIPGTNDGATGSPKGWIQLDLGSVQSIDGVATLGAAGYAYWTKDYSVQVSSDGTNWTNLGRFDGNFDNNTPRYNDFSSPVSCRYIRVFPGGYYQYRAMRLDVYTKTETNVTADNTKFNNWLDQTNNANHAQQTTEANQATYRTNQLNFNPAIVSSNTGNIATSSWYDLPDLSSNRNGYWVAQDVTTDGHKNNHLLANATLQSPSPQGIVYHGGGSGSFNSSNPAEISWRKDATASTNAGTYNFGAVNVGRPNLVTSQ
ncbi:MAG: discoidin domain-containing protein, partial [bacterium]